MKKLGIVVGILLTIVVLLVGAREYLLLKAFNAPEPDALPAPPLNSTLSESSVLMKLSLDLAFLQRLANENIPTTYASTDVNPTSALTDDTSRTSITRGPIRIYESGGRVKVDVPIVDGSFNVKGRFGVRKRNKGPLGWFEDLLSENVSATVRNLRGTLSATVLPVLRSDWSINPQASVDLNVNNARLNVAHVGLISVRGEVEKAFNEDREDNLRDFTNTLNAEANLRGRVGEFWADAFVVEKPTDDPIWVVVKPQRVLSSPAIVADERVTFFLGLSALTSVVLSEEEPNNPATALPNVTLVDAADFGKWRFNVPIQVDYGLLSELLTREASKFSYDDSGVKVSIDSVNVYPNGTELGIKAGLTIRSDWWSKVRATVYLLAEPISDPDGKQLVLANFRLDVESESVLVDSIDYLSRPLLIERLREASVIDLSAIEADAIEQITVQTEPVIASLPDFVEAELDVASITLEDVVVASDQAYVVFSASGAVSANLLEITE